MTFDFDTISRWANTSILGAILFVVIRGTALFLKHSIQTRTLEMEERKQEREGYGPLIQTLREEINRLSAHNADCDARVTRMEGEIRGLYRQIAMQSSNHVMQLSGNAPSQAVINSAGRVAEYVNEANEKEGTTNV